MDDRTEELNKLLKQCSAHIFVEFSYMFYNPNMSIQRVGRYINKVHPTLKPKSCYVKAAAGLKIAEKYHPREVLLMIIDMQVSNALILHAVDVLDNEPMDIVLRGDTIIVDREEIKRKIKEKMNERA